MSEKETREQAERVWFKARNAWQDRDWDKADRAAITIIAAALAEKNREIERLRRHMKWALDSARMWMRNCRWNVIPKWEEAEQREKKSHERAKQLLHCVKQVEADRDRWKARAEELDERSYNDGYTAGLAAGGDFLTKVGRDDLRYRLLTECRPGR